MLEELGNLGTVQQHQERDSALDVVLETTVSEDDITAVLCFVLEPEQIHSTRPTADLAPQVSLEEAALPPAEVVREAPVSAPAPEPTPAPESASAPEPVSAPERTTPPDATAAAAPHVPRHNPRAAKGAENSTSIRVAVEKVDQLINLVGELVITQSMLRSAPICWIRSIMAICSTAWVSLSATPGICRSRSCRSA